MNATTQPAAPRFTGIHWLRSKIPLGELHKQKILLRFHDGSTVRGGIFTLEARPHCSLPEYHHITAERTLTSATGGITTFITFDQHRADQIKRSREAPEDYGFAADIDIGRPLQYVPEIQEAVEKHLAEVLADLTNRSS